ncbi:endonuclease III [Sinanaerobacter chloroacetimidivorans]|jgi:endonuclease-3|uniref:Endonuclease III n=1 Tax=Sinanaerobacter chloroacetimidivorans TaxID=2818044 RepID=A0A8J7W123_9FIRM|nr:endonuclease III [Sinanaerobacter chloroacetimidivorans]MBR0598844.1 endonuclease III [Sinanaerobacter chloroacetimidivorans]
MTVLSKNKIKIVVERLAEMYPEADCELKFGSVFQLLVAVVLSAQTTDKSVNQVTEVLFRDYPDAASLAAVEEEDLEKIIKRIGMYKTKAKNVRKLAQIIRDEYGGEVPGDYEQLIALPGVGRKTANVVLANGFGQQRIAVDTHVFRVSNRIGLVKEPDVLKTEFALMKALPEDQWTSMHHALIWHGRRVCDARKPQCESCGIHDICLFNQRNNK